MTEFVNSFFIFGALLLISSFCLLVAEDAQIKTSKKHEHFIPLVAFQCGHRNKFMGPEGHWQDDPSSAAGCLHGKYDILKYCRRVYPKEHITNIVEYKHLTRIEHWCREEGTDCHHQFTVRPFRCIAGEFVTESLQVPHRCHFSHIAGKDKCNDFKFWNNQAEEECLKKKEEHSTDQQMRLRSFAVLEPCGLGMFRGVEFVCCPKELQEKVQEAKLVVDLESSKAAEGEEEEKKKANKKSKHLENVKEEGEEDDEDEDEDEEEEEYSDEDEEVEEVEKAEHSAAKSKTEEEKSKSSDHQQQQQQDSYFKEELNANEHERFREAEERLEKRHRKKVTKVITEWSELFERYNKMKEKDPSGAEQYKREMTGKFRRTVASLETENREQRKQLEELHDERVQTALNEKKRQATHEYRAALAVQVGRANKQNVLRTLKNYIHAEEKDRLHMLNRYRHLLRSGQQEEALSFEPVLLHRLRYIDLRINGTLAMLRDFPELERELRQQALAFWKAYRRENTPDALERRKFAFDDGEENGEDTKKTKSSSSSSKNNNHYLSDEERNERLIRLYKQNFERKHSSPLGSIISSSSPSSTSSQNIKTAGAVPSVVRKSMVVSLKDMLNEKEKGSAQKELQSLAEDSDEDQFEEDEDAEGEEQDEKISAKITTAVPAAPSSPALAATGASTAEKTPVKIHVELLKAYGGFAQLKKKKARKLAEKPQKLSKSTASSSSTTENEDEDGDEDEDVADDLSTEAKRRRLQHINLEPIVLAPAPNELTTDGEVAAAIAYAKHHRASFSSSSSSHNGEEQQKLSELVSAGSWLADANLLLLLGLLALATASLVIVLLLLRGRRNRHRGFIEVDVCTPEESHVSGMQVNGYENPTYAFFESKQPC